MNTKLLAFAPLVWLLGLIACAEYLEPYLNRRQQS